MSTAQEEPTLHVLASRLAELERANARLQEELLTLRTERAPAGEQTLTHAQSAPLDGSRQTTPPPRKSRRRLLAKGLGVAAVATVGAAAALEMSSGVAHADNIGNFSSSIKNVAAVGAIGKNGAYGVFSGTDTNAAVVGGSVVGLGVYGSNQSQAAGVAGVSQSAYGVYGKSTSGYAGGFSGNVFVSGKLSKGGGSFQIDHPLDPAHKYLFHSFVESPDMKNIYDGVVVLDAHGEADVTLPTWFDTLNTTFRYQLTAIGTSAPDLYIAQKIQDNHFKIAGGKAGMEVCWMVTGIRQDAWANAHRIPVEQDKPTEEQGYYLHPELYGASEEQSVMQARFPGLKSLVLPKK